MALSGKVLNFETSDDGYIEPAATESAGTISIKHNWLGGIFGPPAASDPSLTSGDAGYTYFNTTSHTLRAWTGTAWIEPVLALPTKRILFSWSGTVPNAAAAGQVWRVPYDEDGSTLTFTVKRAYARVETPDATTATSFAVEKSSDGAAFSASTITTVVLSPGTYDDETTGLATSISSGDLVRISFVSVGAAGSAFTVEVVGG